MLGPFRIERLLGKGGMATVYEAYEGGVLDRVVALKVLPPEFLHDGTFASRFAQEARFAAALEHSNIVPIYASGINGGIPWMSMRLLTGGTVADLLADQNSSGVSGEQLWKILRGVAEALDYAHARGVIHRDIKPSNILLDKDGRAYIGDFGLALLLEGGERLTQTRMALGTPRYMAPEQALGQAVDARCDIYSLGAVAYEMLTGTTPFRGSPLAILKQHVEDPIPVPTRTLVSASRFNVLKKALAKKPDDRWESAGQFIAELGSAIHETSATGESRQQSVTVRWAWVTTVLFAALFLLWSAATLDPTRPEVRQADPPAAQTSQPPAQPIPTQPAPSIDTGTAPARTRPSRPSPPVAETPATSPPSPSAAQPVQPPPTTPSDEGGTATANPQPAAAAEVIVSRPVVAVPAAELVGDVVSEPTRIGTIRPDYPRNARITKIEGDVRIQAVISPDGKVTQVRVLSSPNPALNEAAIRAVQRSTYKPGLRNGKPDTFTIEVTVSFRLD
jgi:serine/threonine-protein kinase